MKKFKSLYLLIGIMVIFNSCCEITGDCDPVESEEPTGNVRTFGYIPTSSGQLQNMTYATPPLGGGLPSSADLSSDMPPVGSQGNIGSCVGWAVGYGLKSYHERVEFGHSLENSNGSPNLDNVFSPSYIYNQIKASDCGGGSSITDALNLLKNEGVCSWNNMPYTDLDCETQPNQNQRQQAANNIIESYSLIDIKEPSIVKAFLSGGYPVVIGIQLDIEFVNANDNNGEYIWTANNSPFVEGHAMVVVGYDDARNAYKVFNSWGKNWGNNGYIWIDYEHFNSRVFEGYIANDYTNQLNNDTKIIQLTGSLNFGNVQVGQQATKNLTIENIGTEVLTVSSITPPNGYSLSWNSGTISPSGVQNVVVTFSPQTASAYDGDIIVNSDAQSGTNSIAVTGNGENSNTLQFTDSRDGQIYNYVQIGNNYWMAENLNYDSSNSMCYDNSNSNCNQYGRLYNWQDAMKGAGFSNNNPSGVQGICPNGWHLPSYDEWNDLMNEFDDGNSNNFTSEIYNALIENGSSGFEAKLGGFYSGSWGTFEGLNSRTRFWTTSEFNWGIPYAFFLSSTSTSVELSDAAANNAFYCRCVQD
ncbi:MAG: FISUMP domain-containing protein [Saprospiraceae bacterium]